MIIVDVVRNDTFPPPNSNAGFKIGMRGTVVRPVTSFDRRNLLPRRCRSPTPRQPAASSAHNSAHCQIENTTQSLPLQNTQSNNTTRPLAQETTIHETQSTMAPKKATNTMEVPSEVPMFLKK